MTNAINRSPTASRVGRDDGGGGGGLVLLVFQIAGREHALPVWNVVEVVRMVAATPLPEAPPWLMGVIDFRGRVIPLIEVRTRIGAPARDPELTTPIIVVENDELAAGLVVDEVLEVLAVQSTQLDAPRGPDAESRAVSGVARVGGRLIIVLQWEHLWDRSVDLGLQFDHRRTHEP